MSTLNGDFAHPRTNAIFSPALLLDRTSATRKKPRLKDQADAYRSLIWELARKFTYSSEEAEVAAWEIFSDIRRHAEIESGKLFQRQRPVDRIALARLIRSVR